MNRAVEILEAVAYCQNLSELFEQMIWRYGGHFEATWNNPLGGNYSLENFALDGNRQDASFRSLQSPPVPVSNPSQKIELPQANNLDEPIEL